MTDTFTRFDRAGLKRLCDEKVEESLILEFKLCNELRLGTTYWEKGEQKTRSVDGIKEELSKDISSFLNAAGGTIIYGIKESKSRAKVVDKDDAFKPGEGQSLESLLQSIRSHIQPPPTVNMYRVFEDQKDPLSPWYLVVEVPQGQQAYMAKDKRFYKRVGNIRQIMEQYEVADAMNRTRSAALALRAGLRRGSDPSSLGDKWDRYALDIALTSTNYISSEYGAIKITLARPVVFSDMIIYTFRETPTNTGFFLDGREEDPHAQSLRIAWGGDRGSIIFPGDWYDFHNNSFTLDIPKLEVLPDPTYLMKVELFTLNSRAKQMIFAAQLEPNTTSFYLFEVNQDIYESVFASFWSTYHLAAGSQLYEQPPPVILRARKENRWSNF